MTNGCPVQCVDAFTDRPFHGNPAAVCLLDGPREDAWLAAVAREMNLSETAYLQRVAEGWSLRWFTPVVEVDLCGHATLASAHVLWERELARPDEVLRFHTRSGLLTARREPDGGIVLDFPAEPARRLPPPHGLLDALGVTAPVAVARNRIDYLVELRDAALVRALAPDFARLARIETRGVIVTARADVAAHDFISRWFGPRVGVPEDPVTGSAHCCLGPWWAERLGRTELRGYQASARGGSVGVRVRANSAAGGPVAAEVGHHDRVELVGHAVTVLRGELMGGMHVSDGT